MSVFVSERRLQLGIGPSLEASPLEAPGGAAGRPHYASLDILRLVACALVFVHHGLLDRINIVRSLCDRILPGSLGVNIFFVLSGFLIVNLLIQNRRQNVPTRVFYFKRFARTMPAYFLLMAVYSLLQWHWLPWSIWTYTYNLGPIFGAKYVLNEFQYHDLAPTWSLDVEEQFYLWIPLVVYLLSPKPRRLFLVGIIGLGLLSAHRMNGTEFAGYIAPFPNFVGLACGGLLAEYKDQLFAIKMLPWFAESGGPSDGSGPLPCWSSVWDSSVRVFGVICGAGLRESNAARRASATSGSFGQDGSRTAAFGGGKSVRGGTTIGGRAR